MAGRPATLATREHLSAKPDGSPVPSERHGSNPRTPKAEKRNPPAPRGALLPGAGKSPSPSMQALIWRSASPDWASPCGKKPDYGCPGTSCTRPPKRSVSKEGTIGRAHLQSRTGSPRDIKPVSRLRRKGALPRLATAMKERADTPFHCEMRLVMTCSPSRKGGLDKFRKADPAFHDKVRGCIVEPGRVRRARQKTPRLRAGLRAFKGWAAYCWPPPTTEATSTFTPGPIVEESAMRWR
jgi:hypothetical protein